MSNLSIRLMTENSQFLHCLQRIIMFAASSPPEHYLSTPCLHFYRGQSSSVATYQGTFLDWNKSGYRVVRKVSIRFATRALCSTSFSHSSPAKPSLCVASQRIVR